MFFGTKGKGGGGNSVEFGCKGLKNEQKKDFDSLLFKERGKKCYPQAPSPPVLGGTVGNENWEIPGNRFGKKSIKQTSKKKKPNKKSVKKGSIVREG